MSRETAISKCRIGILSKKTRAAVSAAAWRGSGRSPDPTSGARRRALRAFGGADAIGEEVDEVDLRDQAHDGWAVHDERDLRVVHDVLEELHLRLRGDGRVVALDHFVDLRVLRFAGDERLQE